MPQRMIICLAVSVAFSRSLAAPVVISPNWISSAARPPRVIARVSFNSPMVVKNLSSAGSEMVKPKAAPRETIEILWTGSVWGR